MSIFNFGVIGVIFLRLFQYLVNPYFFKASVQGDQTCLQQAHACDQLSNIFDKRFKMYLYKRSLSRSSHTETQNTRGLLLLEFWVSSVIAFIIRHRWTSKRAAFTSTCFRHLGITWASYTTYDMCFYRFYQFWCVSRARLLTNTSRLFWYTPCRICYLFIFPIFMDQHHLFWRHSLIGYVDYSPADLGPSESFQMYCASWP